MDYKTLDHVPIIRQKAAIEGMLLGIDYKKQFGSLVGIRADHSSSSVLVYFEKACVKSFNKLGLHSAYFPSAWVYSGPRAIWNNAVDQIYVFSDSEVIYQIYCLNNKQVTHAEWLKNRSRQRLEDRYKQSADYLRVLNAMKRGSSVL